MKYLASDSILEERIVSSDKEELDVFCIKVTPRSRKAQIRGGQGAKFGMCGDIHDMTPQEVHVRVFLCVLVAGLCIAHSCCRMNKIQDLVRPHLNQRTKEIMGTVPEAWVPMTHGLTVKVDGGGTLDLYNLSGLRAHASQPSSLRQSWA